MCGGGKSSPAPKPKPITTVENGVADNSNAQRKASIVASSTQQQQPSSFGSELGAGSAASPAMPQQGGL